MAVIGLAGLVINDAIVLIDFINQRRAEGMPLHEALVTAGHQRMRPILMTTITTITGLLPMAIGLPEFSIRWSPLCHGLYCRHQRQHCHDTRHDSGALLHCRKHY